MACDSRWVSWRREPVVTAPISITGRAPRRSRSAHDLIELRRRDLARLIAELSEAQEVLSHLTRCRYDEHMSCPIVSGYLAERVESTLAGQDGPRGESVHSALRRVRAALTDGPDSGAGAP